MDSSTSESADSQGSGPENKGTMKDTQSSKEGTNPANSKQALTNLVIYDFIPEKEDDYLISAKYRFWLLVPVLSVILAFVLINRKRDDGPTVQNEDHYQRLIDEETTPK
jgi:hypothetical protein